MPDVLIKGPRRGHFTCVHGKEAPPIADTERMNHRAMVEPLVKYCMEAARRLPLAEMPYLLECVRDGGLCVGLLDPVSNIIVNAINLFRHRHRLRGGFLAKRMRTSYTANYDPSNEDTYALVAYVSHNGLVAFMHSYFRYLSTKQAQRYLYLAGYDIIVAVLLVEHERQAEPLASPHPGCARTEAALMAAACKAGHSEPDEFVRLLTFQFPAEGLLSLLMELRKGRSLTVNDVERMVDLLDQQPLYPPIAKINFMSRSNGSTLGNFAEKKMHFIIDDLEDNVIIAGTIMEKSSTRNNELSPIHVYRAQEATTMLRSLQKHAASRRCRHTERQLDDTDCQYISSLKMCLVDIVHSLYIKALAQLPGDALRKHHLRGILAAGHCYGPFDPVSNIILNSLWYEVNFPLSHSDDVGTCHIGAADILNTGPLLRMVLHSIDGLIDLLCSLSPTLSKHQAVEFLCHRQCDISELLDNFPNAPYASAAKAAKHPQHSAFVSFLMSLSLDPAKGYLLRSLVSTTAVVPTLSSVILEHAKCLLYENSLDIAPTLQQQAPQLCCQAIQMIKEKKLAFLDQQSFLHAKLRDLLAKHANEHPWMPSYHLDVICGVEMGSYSHSLCYHVNFLASAHCDGSDDEIVHMPKLFFAEVREQSGNRSTRPSFCCLLPSYDACFSRCSMCEAANNKIVHPPSGNHSGGSAGESLDHFGHSDDEAFDLIFSQAKMWNQAPEVVESDFVFFDHIRDYRTASILNQMSSQSYLYEEYMIEEEDPGMVTEEKEDSDLKMLEEVPFVFMTPGKKRAEKKKPNAAKKTKKTKGPKTPGNTSEPVADLEVVEAVPLAMIPPMGPQPSPHLSKEVPQGIGEGLCLLLC